MHRTRTAATLLITLTASAVSGCVSVGGAVAPQSRADAAEPQPLPQADRGGSEPRLVTAPAHEALRMMAPAAPESVDSLRTPERPKRDRSPASAASGPGPDSGSDTARGGGPAQSEQQGRHRRAAGASPLPGVHLPPESLLPGTDLCGLGERYGRWAPESPQARICRAEYGS
ncbi:hypothetical protein [Streptomyces cavernicola]|uniref:Lipoprotein n=1 Tax=Streptomyces cavernicola TaxID=3043613 RepID=A0ABT6SH48_9ACTN|nr:hypothetical protein [Streptomyces sp. B-S-A6]MDI3407526.1 hypothetical protein [Streptomyces sp. B-S-A6]